MPAFNAEELLQISEYLLIFIKASKEWILTVIFTLASASLFLSQQTYPEFTYPSGLLHTAPTFLKTCSQVYSVLHLAVEHWTDCVLNLRKLLCIGDVFYATLETAFSGWFLLTQSGGWCRSVVHTHDGQTAQDWHVCAGAIYNQHFSVPPLIFGVST